MHNLVEGFQDHMPGRPVMRIGNKIDIYDDQPEKIAELEKQNTELQARLDSLMSSPSQKLRMQVDSSNAIARMNEISAITARQQALGNAKMAASIVDSLNRCKVIARIAQMEVLILARELDSLKRTLNN